MTIQRTHDKQVYLAENRYEEPKELFKVVCSQVQRSGVLRAGGLFSDFGCAAGEFLYYARQQFLTAKCQGFDVVPELIEKARSKVSGVEFSMGSVLDRNLMPAASVDVSCLLGVLSIFDEFQPALDNLLYWTRPGGRVYVAALFNPYPIDVWITYRLSSDPNREHRESGWNIFSKTLVSQFLDKNIGQGNYTFTRFQMPFDLLPHADDPVRTWTFLDSGGRRLLTNGLCLICNLEILELRL